MSQSRSIPPTTSVPRLRHPRARKYLTRVHPMPEPPSPLHRNYNPPHSTPSSYPPSQPSGRPRSYNGRFLREAECTTKICGWCFTRNTSQWRVGCTTGSQAMKTLCNACGINYRRTQKRVPNVILDLDVLAKFRSKSLSILKEFKRQQKLSPALTHFIRKPRNHAHRARPRSSNITMLLSDTAPLISRQPPAAPMHASETMAAPSSSPTTQFSNSTCPPVSPIQPLSSVSLPPSPQTRLTLPSFKEITRNLAQMNLP